MRLLVAAIAVVFTTSAFAKPPTMRLDCVKVPNYKTEAERQYLDAASGGGDTYNILVTFVSKRPPNKLVDKLLRQCIAASLKLDDKKDILATAWFRPVAGTNPYDDEQINPYGGLRYLGYSASNKSVSVRELALNKK